MKREDLVDLHYITPIANVPSILTNGIVSHNQADGLHHESVAKAEVQDRRASKRIPRGRPLHDYANLYFHARNPMMFLRKAHHGELCVLRVDLRVLDLRGTVITDENAASDYVRFHGSPAGLEQLDAERVFARDWTHPDEREYWRRKSAKCAEVLVLNHVSPEMILGAWVSCEAVRKALSPLAPGLAISIDPDLFFQG